MDAEALPAVKGGCPVIFPVHMQGQAAMGGLGPVQQRLSDAAGLGRRPNENPLDVLPVQTDESLYPVLKHLNAHQVIVDFLYVQSDDYS